MSVTWASPAAAGDGWRTAADAGVAGLAILAAGKTTAESDRAGAGQLALSLGATAGSAAVLKRALPEMRPNGRNDRSFPSGHTAVAFAAAGYLHQRYGWEWGVPAAAIATMVGVARIRSHDHHWYDVVAGAALGEATAFLITKPRDDGVVIMPWTTRSGAGVSLAARF